MWVPCLSEAAGHLCISMPDGVLPGLQWLGVPRIDGKISRLVDCTATVLAATASTGSCV